MSFTIYLLHFLAFTTITVVISQGIEGRDLAGDVARSMVMALAMLPFLTHLATVQGKPWPAWRSYAFVAGFGVVTVALQYFDPPGWFVVLPLSIGLYMTLKERKRQRQQH